jgi:hypothetical protein
MNANITQALNGVAIAAANAGDMNSVGILQQVACMIFTIGKAYDNAPTSTSLFLNFNLTPFSGQIFEADSAQVKVFFNPPIPDNLGIHAALKVAFIPIAA